MSHTLSGPPGSPDPAALGARTPSAAGLTPPQALDAERSVLAALLLDRDSVGLAIEMLDVPSFYRIAHQKIYDAIVALYNRNERADLVTLGEELRKRGELDAVGGPAALSQILEYASASANLEQHMRLIRSKAILRDLIKATSEIQQEAYAASEETPEILDRAEERIFAITDERVREGFHHIRDLLKPAFEHIEALSKRNVRITGVPSGYEDLDNLTAGFQNSDLVIIAGRPAMGKCLTARTLIDDPDTGARLTIEQFVHEKRARVFGVSEAGEVRPSRVADWVDSGIQPCFRVATRTGRSVEVTGHHPFLTVRGWTPLHDLAVGTRIAVPRAVAAFGADESWSIDRVRLLAFFIAEGGLTGCSPRFTTADVTHRNAFLNALEREFPECTAALEPDGITFRAVQRSKFRKGVQGVTPNPIKEWLRELGLAGKRSAEKRFPDCVWTWPRHYLEEFLRVLFSCDGTIYSMGGYPRIEFTVASEALAQDVHHALCRFGIVSKLWRKTERSWRVEITEPRSVDAYQSEVNWLGEKADRFLAFTLSGPGRRRSHRGHAPQETWELVRSAAGRAGLGLTELARRAGESAEKGFNPHVRRGIPQRRLAAFAEVLEDPGLRRASSSDLYWDDIVAIEPIGSHQVYDLTVPDGSNFIAQDVCVHNTSFAMNIAENSAVRARIPVGIFSLEMSKDQLVQRLLCSQGGVALHRVRSGQLAHEDWPRLTTAAGLLTRAPIMIDDSATLSLTEIRAKCRRLKAEHQLGLVVIDYLQLIRPGHTAENRVQEIGQITRGLKALAKELSLPVVALSQLSRAVETRDKSGRPQLSDLRESGSIEQDADVVMFVYREEVYKPDTSEKGKATIILAKQRNGPTGDVPLTFLRESTKFVPYTPVMAGETEEAF